MAAKATTPDRPEQEKDQAQRRGLFLAWRGLKPVSIPVIDVGIVLQHLDRLPPIS